MKKILILPLLLLILSGCISDNKKCINNNDCDGMIMCGGCGVEVFNKKYKDEVVSNQDCTNYSGRQCKILPYNIECVEKKCKVKFKY